jgi:hypothetical protein
MEAKLDGCPGCGGGSGEVFSESEVFNFPAGSLASREVRWRAYSCCHAHRVKWRVREIDGVDIDDRWGEDDWHENEAPEYAGYAEVYRPATCSRRRQKPESLTP